MAFKYRGGDRTTEDVARRSKMAGGSYDNYLSQDVPFFKAKEGDNTIRLLPRTWDDKERWGTGWEITAWIHRNVGPNDDTYLCLDKMKGERCPICEAAREMDEDEANAVRLQARPLCYVIDRDNEKSGPQIMGMPVTLFREINNRSTHKKSGKLLILDGYEDLKGHDVSFTREGTDKKTKYTSVEVDPEATHLGNDEKQEDRWLTFIEEHPLPDMLIYFDADHIEKVLFGRAEKRRGDDDNDNEEEDRRGRRDREDRPRRGRGDRDEAESEDKEDRPSRRRGRDDEGESESRTTRSRGGRGGDDDEGGEEKEERSERSSRRGRDAERDEEDERHSRRGDKDADEGGGKVERRRSRSEDSDDDDSPSSRAKGRLERLKSRR